MIKCINYIARCIPFLAWYLLYYLQAIKKLIFHSEDSLFSKWQDFYGKIWTPYTQYEAVELVFIMMLFIMLLVPPSIAKADRLILDFKMTKIVVAAGLIYRYWEEISKLTYIHYRILLESFSRIVIAFENEAWVIGLSFITIFVLIMGIKCSKKYDE